MRVLGLPLVAQLGDRLLLAGREEDRVVAEALAPTWLHAYSSLEDAGSAHLVSGGGECDQLADVARPSPVAFYLSQLREQPFDRVAAAEASRKDSGTAAQSLDLEPRVLAHDPDVVGALRSVPRLGKGVLVVRRALLGRIAGGAQQLQLPPLEHARQLAQLVLVPGGELGPHSAQRTSS